METPSTAQTRRRMDWRRGAEERCDWAYPPRAAVTITPLLDADVTSKSSAFASHHGFRDCEPGRRACGRGSRELAAPLGR